MSGSWSVGRGPASDFLVRTSSLRFLSSFGAPYERVRVDVLSGLGVLGLPRLPPSRSDFESSLVSSETYYMLPKPVWIRGVIVLGT